MLQRGFPSTTVGLPVTSGKIEVLGQALYSVGQVICGGLLQQLSLTVTVNQQEVVFPQSSVAV